MAAVCDLDPQSSYSDWYARRGSPDNPALLRGASHASDAIEALRQTSPYDYVFLDGPPGSILVTEDAVRVSTLVVIPIRASGLDLASSQDAIQLCQELGTACLVVINGKVQHDGRLVEEARPAPIMEGAGRRHGGRSSGAVRERHDNGQDRA